MSYGPYSDLEYGKLRQKLTRYSKIGHPEWAARLQLQMDNEVPFNEIVLPEELDAPKSQIRPETNVAVHLLDVPARRGRGSSSAEWRQFARLVSNISTEVLENMGRSEIITVLEDRGILPPETPETSDDA